MSEEFDDDFDDFEDLSLDLEEVAPHEMQSNPPKKGKVSIFFQSTIGPSQRQEKMEIANEALVMDLKYTISQIFGLPHEEFHLSHAGRTMDPDDLVSNYNIEDGDTLLLIPVSIAG